ncbi:hypothetical protein ACFY3N_31450 [Streptomyces sp. NPDC000348]|uniref:hypothetical protein n=1 Tax=Streptomyces sp. NPDC000348 TaxID=3364538 RepID=UPI0036A6CD66
MTDLGLLAPAIIAAALVIRTAIGELRSPGSARAQWAFATDRRALAAGIVAAAATRLLGRPQMGLPVAAWALLIGTLTAHLTHHAARRP